MPTTVLVAYASRHGATRGIAERIAETLRQSGLEVTLQDLVAERYGASYDAYVIGSAAYAGKWLGEAGDYVRRNQALLASRPVWLFSSGPLDTSADTTDIPPVPQAAEAASRLGAREHITFGGRLTEQARGFLARAMVRNGRGGDFRNPQRIAAWAQAIADQLLTDSGSRP